MKLLLVGGPRMVRSQLRELFEGRPALELVAEAEDARCALGLIERLDPDVAVIDLEMPFCSAVQALRRMRGLRPDLKIVTLTLQTDRRYIDECFLSGADGVLLKDCAYEELPEAVDAVLCGRHYLGRSLRVMSG